MLKDFRDGNKDVITMFRDTDKTHSFRVIEESGSKFIWNNYTIICEGRLALGNSTPDFTFGITNYDVDGIDFGHILFDKENINHYVRENRVYWRVLATHKTTLQTKVIRYGEILLKDF